MINNSNLSDINDEIGQYVIAVDFGTTLIRVCAALVYPDEIKIIGYGKAETKGFSEDGISSMDKLKESLSKAYNIANTAVRSIYNKDNLPFIDNPRIFVSIPGKYIECRNNDGSCEINHRPVTNEQMIRAFKNACSLSVEGKELIYATTNYFQVDSHNYIEDPLSLVGGQLKNHAHLIFADSDFITNIKYVVSSCIQSKYMYEFVFTGTASANAILTETEKNLGVCVLDIGGGSVDISVYDKGYLIYSGSSYLAGHYATRSIAVANGLAECVAEGLKLKYGTLNLDEVNMSVKVNSEMNFKPEICVSLKDIAELLSADYNLMFKNAIKSVKGVELELGAGFVLTGGSSAIKGVTENFANVLKEFGSEHLVKKIRIGSISENVTGLTQEINKSNDSVIIGLLKLSRVIETKKYIPPSKSKIKNFLNNIILYWQQEM
jgi:cell division protein FtsA